MEGTHSTRFADASSSGSVVREIIFEEGVVEEALDIEAVGGGVVAAWDQGRGESEKNGWKWG